MRKILGAVILLAAFAGEVSAREAWLIPSSFQVKTGEVLRFDLTSGLEFPKAGNVIQPTRIASAGLRLGSTRSGLSPWRTGTYALTASASLPTAGLACAWVELKPMDIQLTDAQVEPYFQQIGASAAVRAQWESRKRQGAWKERFAKHAKTFVAAGNAAEDLSWRDPVGMPFELVPLSSPVTMRAGESVKVRLLHGGRPEPNATVGLMQGSRPRVFFTTDADGLATFTLPSSGPALFFAVLLHPADNADLWVSDFTTLSVNIRP